MLRLSTRNGVSISRTFGRPAVLITDPDKRGVFLVRLGAHLREAGPALPQSAFERLLEHRPKGLVQTAT
jgi:hypothetical protein